MLSQINPKASDTIYVNDRPLIFTDNAIYYRTTHPETADYRLLKSADPGSLHDAIRDLEQENHEGILIEDKDTRRIQKNLNVSFTKIEAAGGLVSEPGGKVLMIFRRGKWDLPKGKIDEGETLEKAAVREVLEETGLPEVRLLNQLSESWHIYKHKGLHVLKTTHWFTMEVQDAYPLIPQEEEDITIAEWANAEQIKEHLQNSFETIKSVFKKAGRMPV